MCGITGLLGNGGDDEVQAMLAMLRHRGPDGPSTYSDNLNSGKGSIAFGHARLSIIDLDGSRQPLGSDHGCVLVQNGEIYNYLKLKQNNREYPFRTSGDGETILSLHREYAWGKSSGNNPALKHVDWVRKLDGMWAFALWDPMAEELVLCRDAFGVKPLMRTILDDGTLLFGSEVKSFNGHMDFIARPDINALSIRLAYEYPLDQTTLFSGVTSVGIGTIETWSLDKDGQAVMTGFAEYEKTKVEPGKKWNPESQASLLLDSMSSSIEDRLMSDVPVGIVLSGGLDSSLIAGLAHDAADSTGKPTPDCWTVADSEENVDYKAAQLVAQHHDLNHHTSIMDSDVFWKDLPKFAWHGEDLDVTVLFWQSVFELMRGKVTVALCGQGADELHAGYPRYRNLSKHASLIRKRMDLADVIEIPDSERGAGKAWSSESISPEINMNNLTNALEFEQTRGQLNNFQLRLGERHSMADGLEARVPFLSSKHCIMANRLPLNWRISADDEKMALRAAANLTNMPKEIVRRPKLPAGTATSPTLVSQLIEELRPRAVEWASEYGKISKQLHEQPDMAIGVRLFHAMHLTDSSRMRSGDLLSVLEDVSDWPKSY